MKFLDLQNPNITRKKSPQCPITQASPPKFVQGCNIRRSTRRADVGPPKAPRHLKIHLKYPGLPCPGGRPPPRPGGRPPTPRLAPYPKAGPLLRDCPHPTESSSAQDFWPSPGSALVISHECVHDCWPTGGL